MNILQINAQETKGGAAVAANRLHQGLLAHGTSSEFLVGEIQINGPTTAEFPRRLWLEKRIDSITFPLGLNYLGCVGSFDLPMHPSFAWADIINFHNLHGGFFNYLALPFITRKKPSVWTLHDMWAITGHCSYSFGCERWRTGCGKCPQLSGYPPIPRDATKWEFRLKEFAYNHSNIVVVTPSKWLFDLANNSILNKFPIHHIPYGIDTGTYRPLNTETCREEFGIPSGKKVLLFSAESLSDLRKGGDLVIKAVESLPRFILDDCVLLTFGSANVSLPAGVDLPIINLGFLSSDKLKAAAYSSADIFLFPTRADNLPLVLMESLACGTPMVAAETGGVSDLVRNGETGFLHIAGDYIDLSRKIADLLLNDKGREVMSQNCRRIAVREYTLEKQANRYINIYNELL